jgi:hypothetical protein
MGHVVKAVLVSAGLCILLAACVSTTPGNPLLGDWVVDLPTTPRAHGSLVGFREGCVFVRGNRMETRVAKPAQYQIGNTDALVWYGDAARTESRNPAKAARVIFLAPDRIHITWPEGFDERYMRGIGNSRSGTDCR